MTEEQKKLLVRAMDIATAAHAGQTDKFGMPYILHVTRVMERGITWEEKICGLLHDLIEDTPWTLNELTKEGFPEYIVEIIGLLTKPEGADYLEYVKQIGAHPLARRVKLNDLQDNMDIRRMPELTAKDAERLNKYLKAFELLTELDLMKTGS